MMLQIIVSKHSSEVEFDASCAFLGGLQGTGYLRNRCVHWLGFWCGSEACNQGEGYVRLCLCSGYELHLVLAHLLEETVRYRLYHDVCSAFCKRQSGTISVLCHPVELSLLHIM